MAPIPNLIAERLARGGSSGFPSNRRSASTLFRNREWAVRRFVGSFLC